MDLEKNIWQVLDDEIKKHKRLKQLNLKRLKEYNRKYNKIKGGDNNGRN